MRHPAFPLFLPATRLDRLAKACGSGADAVILDLEDAVAPPDRDAAREGLLERLRRQPAGQQGGRQGERTVPLIVRINACSTSGHEADVRVCRELPVQAVMLAKAEAASDCRVVAERTGKPVIALIETALGLAQVQQIATESVRLAFGSIDYAADLGMAHSELALLHARSCLVHAARLAGQVAPLDGVTADFRNADLLAAQSRHGRDIGFGGKLLIHPRQIDVARRSFAPTRAEQDWARGILDAAAGSTEAVVQWEGTMVDAPVIKRAQSILGRATDA